MQQYFCDELTYTSPEYMLCTFFSNFMHMCLLYPSFYCRDQKSCSLTEALLYMLFVKHLILIDVHTLFGNDRMLNRLV
jgi:hypothetical protein